MIVCDAENIRVAYQPWRTFLVTRVDAFHEGESINQFVFV